MLWYSKTPAGAGSRLGWLLVPKHPTLLYPHPSTVLAGSHGTGCHGTLAGAAQAWIFSTPLSATAVTAMGLGT